MIWSKGKPVPRIEDMSSAYIENEEPAMSLIWSKLEELTGNDGVSGEVQPIE
ncbi:hypothetical protein D9M72_643960 [compost metagenome]